MGIVVWSAVVQGAAAFFIALFPSYESTMIGAALLGLGYGAYMSVGLALGTDLLPYPEDHARDLGFVNVSASLGQLHRAADRCGARRARRRLLADVRSWAACSRSWAGS